MWVIDIRDLLDDSFTRAAHPRFTSRVKKLAQIISYATAMDSGTSVDFLPVCRRRTKSYPCTGVLEVEVRNKEIHCKCPVCNDEGVIKGWRGLIWDLSGFRSPNQN